MPDDLARRMERQMAALQDGDIDNDDFAKFVTRMRAQFGDVAVDAVLQAQTTDALPSATTLTISGGMVTAAVAGSVYGNIYINGQWTRDEASLIHAYLSQLVARFETLSLQGIREQKATTDVQAIKLEQVYTQLATKDEASRETFDREAVRTLNVEQFVREHIGDHVLPTQQRTYVLEHFANSQGFGFTPLRELDDGLKIFYDLQASKPHPLIGLTIVESTFYGPQLVTEAIVENKRLVLLGEPGSGKSTTLRYLTLTLARAGLDQQLDLNQRLQGWQGLGEQQHLLPVFFPLLSFARWLLEHPHATGTVHDLWNAIADYVDPPRSSSGLASLIHQRVQAGDVLLLLDGLDEVVTHDSRRKVVRAVQQFGDEFRQCRIVVTCRVRAYEGEQNQHWQLPSWSTTTLADWTAGQMEAFVIAWYGEVASTMDTIQRSNRMTALQQAIATRDELRRLGVRPLLLTVMALVHLNDGRLLEDMPSLLSRCIDILLAQWELGRNDGSQYGTLMDYIGLPRLSVQNLRPLLEEAAFLAHEATTPDSQGLLSRADLYYLVARELQRLKHPDPWQEAEHFLDYTDKRAGLLHANAVGNAYTFPLHTFQEYLAGHKLVSGVDPVPGILQRRMDDRWYRPIALGIGSQVTNKSLAVPYQLFQKLIRLKDTTLERAHHDFLLAADLGAEVGWDRLIQGDELFEGVWQELAAKLALVVEGAALPATARVRAGAHLGGLGDPRPSVCTLPPAMVQIPGGTFVIGVTEAECAALPSDAQPFFRNSINDDSVIVKPFAISTYLVTNAQYQLFIDADGYNPMQPWWNDDGRAWLWEHRNRRVPESWNMSHLGFARLNHPVVTVSWYEAHAFCRWLTQHRDYNPTGVTYRLPTEVEWEWTARGPARRIYPWGSDEPDGERANYGGTHRGTTAVGCFPAGTTREGVHELTGNVSEWTSSEYATYPYRPMDGHAAVVHIGPRLVIVRGGAWDHQAVYLHAAYRNLSQANGLYNNVGFRLAIDCSI